MHAAAFKGGLSCKHAGMCTHNSKESCQAFEGLTHI
jgi:hypothetical protein